MVHATNIQVQIRRLLMRCMIGKAVNIIKKMQTLLYHILARKKKLLNVCFISIFLLLSRAENVTSKYTRFCCRPGRTTGRFIGVWNTYSYERLKKTFRVSRRTFQFIPSRIRQFLQRDTLNKEPSSGERLKIPQLWSKNVTFRLGCVDSQGKSLWYDIVDFLFCQEFMTSSFSENDTLRWFLPVVIMWISERTENPKKHSVYSARDNPVYFEMNISIFSSQGCKG